MVYFLLGLVLLVIIILAVPISLGYNSLEKWLKVRWLGFTFTKGLDGEKPKKPKKLKKPKKIPESPITKKKVYGPTRLLWQRRDLLRELGGKSLGFAREVWQTLVFRDSEATFSLPDPLWNGIFSAVLLNFQVRNLDLWVNFEERNYAKIWVTIYPYRVLGKLAVFLCHLPYGRLIRLAWDLRKARLAG